MTKRYLLLAVLFLGVCHSVFSQTADIDQGCYPLTVEFTGPISASYFWNFGDGAFSTLQNPSNTYTLGGDFIVEFSETENGPVIGTVTINVYAPLAQLLLVM